MPGDFRSLCMVQMQTQSIITRKTIQKRKTRRVKSGNVKPQHKNQSVVTIQSCFLSISANRLMN